MGDGCRCNLLKLLMWITIVIAGINVAYFYTLDIGKLSSFPVVDHIKAQDTETAEHLRKMIQRPKESSINRNESVVVAKKDVHPFLRHLNKTSPTTRAVGTRGYAPLVGPIEFPDENHWTADQIKVRDAMQWAWKGYRSVAFGSDTLNVKLKRGQIWNGYDLGLTIIDSLDTLFIMGLRPEFDEGLQWVEENLPQRIGKSVTVNLFESTIRILGGLLTCYHFTANAKILQLADAFGDRLLAAFTSGSKIPFSDVNLGQRTARAPSWGDSSLSEVSTIQLEFQYLSKLTGKPSYGIKADAVLDQIDEEMKKHFSDGVLPIYINAKTGKLKGSAVQTLGARGDSYYEYLLKRWLLTGKKESKHRERYEHAIEGIMTKLVGYTKPSNLTFIGEWSHNSLSPKMDHLVCFLPGLLALGYVNGMPKSHMDLAQRLMYSCYQMYALMASGLAPEIVVFNTDSAIADDLEVKPNDAFNILRPETVESLMILYRVTLDPKYQEWGRQIFNAFEKHCRLPDGGYTSVHHVTKSRPSKMFRSEMESFFLAETLKYLFLLFSDDPDAFIPLDKYVYNTEAHPFPIWESA